MDMSIPPEAVEGVQAGGTFKWHGATFQIIRKGSTALSARRYYWWDAVYDWCVRKIKDRGVSS